MLRPDRRIYLRRVRVYVSVLLFLKCKFNYITPLLFTLHCGKVHSGSEKLDKTGDCMTSLDEYFSVGSKGCLTLLFGSIKYQ